MLLSLFIIFLAETSSSSSNESLSDLSDVSNEHKALDFKLIVDDVKSGQQVRTWAQSNKTFRRLFRPLAQSK